MNDNNLERVYLQNGKNTIITEINLLNNANLECVAVDDETYSTTNWTNKDNQTSFSTNCNSVWEIYTEDEAVDTALEAIPGLDDDGDGKITYEEAQAFTGDLDLSGQNITDATGLEAFSNAESIDVSGNSITDISNLLDNTSVVVISKATGNKRSIARNNNEGIKKLNVANNLIEEIDISKVSSITELIISNNKLTYLNLNNNSNATLIKFDATGNPELKCIQVDDVTNAENNANWKKDATASYNTFCPKKSLSTQDLLKESLSIYPNPVTSNFTIKLINQINFVKVDIYNLVGKKVITSKNLKVDVNLLPAGIYMTKIYTDKGIVTSKLVKN